MPAVSVPEVDHWLILVGGGCKTATIIFSSDCLQSVCSCSFSTVLQMIALNLLFSVFHHQSYFAFFFSLLVLKSQLFKTIFKNKSVFESQIKIELIIHQMWKTSSEITSQYLILFHCQKWSPKSSRLQPLKPTCPLRKQTALRAKKIVNFRYQKWKHFVEGFSSTKLDLLTSRAFERVARQWARSASESEARASERKLVVRAGSYHTRPENQANDFEKVYD